MVDADHQPTPENLRLQRLRQSVKRLSQYFLEGKQKSISAGFYNLGHCLAFLGDSRSAQFSFRQQLAALRHGDEPMYERGCQNASCANKAGFVCSTCPDVILCASCFRVGLSEKAPGGHGFIEIPVPSEEDCRAWEVPGRMHKGVEKWLNELIERYD